jgi:hypothetical protein
MLSQQMTTSSKTLLVAFAIQTRNIKMWSTELTCVSSEPFSVTNQNISNRFRMLSVIEVMKDWVAICLVDRDVLVKIQQFAMNIHSSERMNELAMELDSITTKRV